MEWFLARRHGTAQMLNLDTMHALMQAPGAARGH
jgi:hypothetical protein